MTRPFLARSAACLCAALLAACAAPTPTPAGPQAQARPTAVDTAAAGLHAEQAALHTFAHDQRERARQARLDGRPLDAQLAWAAVLALASADAEALAGREQARLAAQHAAQERARRAEQAATRGEIEAAMRWHLEALAHDPGLAASAQALRSLERERALRNAAPMAFARPPTPTATSSKPYASELDNAELLLAEGDLDGALLLLEPAARDSRADIGLKQRTCELLLRQAQALAPQQRGAARAAVQRCLRLLPQHAAAQRLERALREPAPQ